jgi:hypothetical protein
MHGRDPGHRRQLAGSREPLPSLVLQPCNAGFQPLKIVAAGGRLGPRCRGTGPAIGRPGGSKMGGGGI